MIRIFAVAAILLLAVPGSADELQDDVGLYLFSFPADSAASLSGVGREAPLAKLFVTDAERLASAYANSAVNVVSKIDDAVVVTANTSGVLGGELSAQHTEASFVVDYDEPAVIGLSDELRNLHGDQPNIDDIVAFTFNAIPDKTYLRDFDFASRVAQYGEGDCTEHAVLLAGLTRATGRPAKVIIGLMLVQTESDFLVYGHAWSEIYDDDSWQVADATLPAKTMPEATIRYLPMMEMKDEGPGYGLAMAYMIDMLPKRVDLITSSHFENVPN